MSVLNVKGSGPEFGHQASRVEQLQNRTECEKLKKKKNLKKVIKKYCPGLVYFVRGGKRGSAIKEAFEGELGLSKGREDEF